MHRLDEIRCNSRINDLNYIPTNLNISDLCTRPIDFTDFINNRDYLSGPRFLLQKDLTAYLGREKIYNDIECDVSTFSVNEVTINKSNVQWQNFSSWRKLLRAILLLKCFIQKFKHRINRSNKGTVEKTKPRVEQIKDTHDTIIKLIQKETFQQELHELSYEKRVNQKNYLLNLNPILEDNILKVGGRLKNVNNIPTTIKHQIILPRNHPVTNLLIMYYHETNHHCGRNQTLALLREKYWIVKGKSIIRTVLSTCLLCR